MTNVLHKLSPKTKRIIAAVLSLALVLGAVSFIAPVEAQALAINASDSGYYNVASGTDDTPVFVDGTRIRVINQTREGKSKSDAVYEYDETSLKWSAESNYLVWDNSEETNTFYGIYPYNAEYKTFTIPDDQSGGVQDADWMTATYTGAETNSVDLEFSHLLTKVTIKINSWGTEYDDTAKAITEAKIYSLATDIKKDDSGVATANTASLTAITPLYNETEKTYTAIICPGTYTKEQQIMSLKVNDTDSLTVLANANLSLTTNDGLQPGYHYTFNLTVGKDAVEISSVNVTDWKNGGMIDGTTATQAEIGVEMNGTTATLTIPYYATDVMVKNTVAEVIEAGATELMIEGEPTAAQQEAIAAVLTGKSGIALVMGGVSAPESAITALTDIDLAYKNGEFQNAYALTKSGGYIITSKDGLNNWRNAASKSPYNTNLTLACDIEYHGRWYAFDPNTRDGYTGVIDGNGYAIKGLRCTQVIASTAGSIRNTFIDTLGEGGVIKNLGLSGGICKNTDSSLSSGGFGFVGYNYGVIMGCYNANECKTEISSGYGHAAGIAFDNYGVIIGCYNIANISTNIGDYSAGIAAENNSKGKILACYNTGSITGEKPAGIVGTNMYKSSIVSDCYYRGATLGVYNEENTTTPSTTSRLTSTGLTDMVSKMNAAIEAYNETATVKCNYKYVINTDAATKDARPLLIAKVN